MATSSGGLLLRISKFSKNLNVRKNSTANSRVCLGEERKFRDENDEHVYKIRLDKAKIIDEMVKNVVHKTDDFIVTSKPYGVGKEKGSKQIENYIPQTFDEFYLNDILPEAAKRLGYDLLEIAKTPERFASGVLILTGTEAGKTQISKANQKAQDRNSLFHKYLVVTKGHPIQEKMETKFGIQFVSKDGVKIPTIVEKWSKNNVKKGLVKTFQWKHTVLSRSELASLVKVELCKTHKNCLKLFLATKCFSPVLGDQLYSRRVIDVFGVPMLVDPAISSNSSESFNPKLLSSLRIQENEIKLIPSHVHLHSLSLPFKKNLEFSVSVPPPKSFIWTCEQLGLNLDIDLCDNDEETEKE